MDAKITKKRLSHMLSYDWLKIIATAVGVIFIWMAIFTMTATRIQPSQQFGVFNFLGTTQNAQNFRNYASLTDVFSHEIIQTIAGDLTTGGEEYVYQYTEARMAACEVDAVFVSDSEGSAYQYVTEQGGEPVKATYLEEFLYRYRNYTYRLDGEDGYLKSMEKYLNGYYNGDYKTGEFDSQKVEKNFRDYVASSKDKRYKTEESIALGVQNELKRIANYQSALVDFYSYLDLGYISLTEKTLYYSTKEGIFEYKGVFSINLCPTEQMENLKNDVYYRVKDDESGQTKTTALNMNLVLTNDQSKRDSFQYESLVFVNHLVKKHCLALNKTNGN